MKKEKDGTLTENILDAESDVIKCKFNNDGCVELDTDDYSFITLSVSNLYELIELIEKAEKKYKKLDNVK
jgi:hypothetical protein